MPSKSLITQTNTNSSSLTKKDWQRNWSLYLMVLPVLAFYMIFCYKPMYGALIAFKDFSPRLGVMGSPWIGLENFMDFFQSRFFARTLINTLRISITTIIFGFPSPIILALLINEIKNKLFVRTVQTITYLPHFISLVVICGMIRDFSVENGILTNMLVIFGAEPQNLLNNPSLFVPIYVVSDIWQNIGWGSIIYLAAILGIDQELYEAAVIDGAGRWRQTFHITLPSIMPTILTLFILRMGAVMSVGFEKIILLYNPRTYEAADVISSFVYRAGLQEFRYGFSTAVGLFNSVINFIFVVGANNMSRKFNEVSLW